MLPALAVLCAAVLFGTTGTAQALGPADTTPLGVGAMRMVVGGAALAAVGFTLARRRRIASAHRNPPLTGRALALMALTGVCLAAYGPLFFVGTSRSGVAVGTVIALGVAPVMAGLIEWLLTRRRPRPIWIWATAAATGGVVLLAFGGGARSDTLDPIGLAGSLAAGTAFAIYANGQRRLMDAGWDPFTVAGAMGAGAAVCASALLPFTDLRWLAEPSGVAMTLWLGLGTTALAYTAFTWGLERLRAATAATLTLAEPLTASLLGILVLGERLSAPAIAGLVVLAAGLALLAWGTRARADAGSALLSRSGR